MRFLTPKFHATKFANHFHEHTNHTVFIIISDRFVIIKLWEVREYLRMYSTTCRQLVTDACNILFRLQQNVFLCKGLFTQDGCPAM